MQLNDKDEDVKGKEEGHQEDEEDRSTKEEREG